MLLQCTHNLSIFTFILIRCSNTDYFFWCLSVSFVWLHTYLIKIIVKVIYRTSLQNIDQSSHRLAWIVESEFTTFRVCIQHDENFIIFTACIMKLYIIFDEKSKFLIQTSKQTSWENLSNKIGLSVFSCRIS